MNILIVVAHPDDEVLGCGATASKLAGEGHNVRSCILSARAEARQNSPSQKLLAANMKKAQKILGFAPPFSGAFPNIKLNTVPHIQLVQFIENAILEHGAELIFTHHPVDVNNDHYHTSIACQAAARLFQRRSGVPPLKGLYFMEVVSSTDWSFPGTVEAFRADTFFPIGKDGVEKKLEAMKVYKGVLREFPHSRSPEIIQGLAAFRGGMAGCEYAEAFQTAFSVLGAFRGDV